MVINKLDATREPSRLLPGTWANGERDNELDGHVQLPLHFF